MKAVLNALETISATTDERLIAHRDGGLVRTTGSFVPGLGQDWQATRDFLSSLDWEEVAWDSLPEGCGIPIARYFKATGSGVMNTMTVGEARRRGITLEVRVHKPDPTGKSPNPRGLGVFAQVRAADVQTQTDEVWLILGPSGDLVIPWCWHPGAPAVPVVEAHYDALDNNDWSDPELQNVNVHLLQ
jgi:hypothetical protein